MEFPPVLSTNSRQSQMSKTSNDEAQVKTSCRPNQLLKFFIIDQSEVFFSATKKKFFFVENVIRRRFFYLLRQIVGMSTMAPWLLSKWHLWSNGDLPSSIRSIMDKLYSLMPGSHDFLSISVNICTMKISLNLKRFAIRCYVSLVLFIVKNKLLNDKVRLKSFTKHCLIPLSSLLLVPI